MANYIVSNIYHLCKTRKININTIEKAAGVSVGYLSRRKKVGDVSLDVLYNASKIFKLPMDLLVHKDLSKEDEDKIKLSKLLNKLADECQNWSLVDGIYYFSFTEHKFSFVNNELLLDRKTLCKEKDFPEEFACLRAALTKKIHLSNNVKHILDKFMEGENNED